jgi:hypothetical protein
MERPLGYTIIYSLKSKEESMLTGCYRLALSGRPVLSRVEWHTES